MGSRRRHVYPCAPHSRLGLFTTPLQVFPEKWRRTVRWPAFHASVNKALSPRRDLVFFERLFGEHIAGLKWVNFGGGHHLTRTTTIWKRLIRIIALFKEIRSPGIPRARRGKCLSRRVLVASVLMSWTRMTIAIIDASAEAHMPDSCSCRTAES